jgi:prevent-host-death family protein
MITVGAFEAKTKFSELLDRVERGEEVVVTRHGKIVARMVPEGVSTKSTTALAKRILDRRRAIGKRLEAGGEPPITTREIREWIDEGRR